MKQRLDPKTLIYTKRSVTQGVQGAYPGSTVVKVMQAKHGESWKVHRDNSLTTISKLAREGCDMVCLQIRTRTGGYIGADYFLDELGRERWEPGDTAQVAVNQGERDATILAVIEDEALLEYEMPGGTTALWVISSQGPGVRKLRNVSYKDVPAKWLSAIEEAGTELRGNPQ